MAILIMLTKRTLHRLQDIILVICVMCALTNSPLAQNITKKELCLDLTNYSPSFGRGVEVWEIEVEKAEARLKV